MAKDIFDVVQDMHAGVEPFAIATLQPGQGDFVVIATQHKGDHESMQRGLYRAVRDQRDCTGAVRRHRASWYLPA